MAYPYLYRSSITVLLLVRVGVFPPWAQLQPEPVHGHRKLREPRESFTPMAGIGNTIIIGAAGAVGKRLCAALSARGHRVVASDRMPQLPGSVCRAVAERGATVGASPKLDLA